MRVFFLIKSLDCYILFHNQVTCVNLFINPKIYLGNAEIYLMQIFFIFLTYILEKVQMFRSRQYSIPERTDDSGFYRLKKSFNTKPKRGPLRRFECFDADDHEERISKDEEFLNEISQKICLITLQVSRIENRLSAFETQSTDEFQKPYVLKDPPNCPPTEPIRRKKTKKSTYCATSVSAKNLI